MSAPLPDYIPPLPLPGQAGVLSWPSNVLNAYQLLADLYGHALRALHSDVEPLRLQFHSEAIVNDGFPMILAFEYGQNQYPALQPWIERTAQIFINLLEEFHNADERMSRFDSSVQHIEPIWVARSGKPGRPRKIPDQELMKEAFAPGRNISVQKMAKTIGVHRNTLSSYLHDYGISSPAQSYSTISDHDLDTLIKNYRDENPQSGIRYLRGRLRTTHGLRIQKRRIKESIDRVDPLGTNLRNYTTVRRRVYSVSRPNALWHLDGHHKLIRWGIVIHGMIDGYCRSVVALEASTNNRAPTVFALFLTAIDKYGLPSRVRGDRGGENVQVSVHMIIARGLNRASFIWGTSTRNNRIERLWLEVGTQFARKWRAFFQRLEQLHGLDSQNKNHLWLLHLLYLDDINCDCEQFCLDWNSHPVSGVGHDQSPNDMRLLGRIDHGEYKEDCDGLDPAIIEKYYGLDEDDINEDGSHDSADSESESDISDNLDERIGADIQSQFHHTPVPVPKHQNPFEEDQYNVYIDCLAECIEQNIIPAGYNVLEAEWDDQGYPSFEILKSGRRATRELRIPLPIQIWLPRAKLWVQALVLMNSLLEEE